VERASAARPICGHLKALELWAQVSKAEEQERKAAALEAEAGKAAKEQAARVVLKMQRDRVPAGAGKPPPPRTKWTRRVPHPVLIGHAASLTPY
jgi:hypothetical protein